MCKWGQLIAVNTLRAGNDGIRYGWNVAWIDRCLAALIQRMNVLGIETSNCCCGHGDAPGWITVDPESIPLLDKHDHQWVWPKDDPTDDREWWRARNDIVIIKLPQIEKTWGENEPAFGGWA